MTLPTPARIACRVFSALCVLFVVLSIPGLLILFFAHQDLGTIDILHILDQFDLANGWDAAARAAAEAAVNDHFAARPAMGFLHGAVVILITVPQLIAVARLAQVLLNTADGRFFTPLVVGRLRAVANWALLWAVAAPVGSVFLTYLYAAPLEPLSRGGDLPSAVTVWLATLLFIAVFWIFSWILDHGRRLREESEAFV